jgi:hypothetical protein
MNYLEFNGQNESDFLGKKIVTKEPSSGLIFVGICKFIGYNKYLNDIPHITVGNRPIYPANFKKIIILDDDEFYDFRYHKL